MGQRPGLGRIVVHSGDATDVVAGLRRLQIRVLVQPAAKNLTQTYAQIRQLGSITGHRKAAAKLVTNMKRSIARVLKATPKRRLSVYHELTPDYYSATSQTLLISRGVPRVKSKISLIASSVKIDAARPAMARRCAM